LSQETFLTYYQQTALKKNERNSRCIQVAYRFVGSALAYAIKDSAIRPNHLTLANLILGIVGNILIGFNAFGGAIWLAFAFHQFAFVLDYTDGSLARLQGRTSKFGSWFDANTDVLKEVTLIFATCWYGYSGASEVIVWPLGLLLVSAIYATTKVRDSYTKLAAQARVQSVAYRLKQRMVIARQFHFTSLYLYIVLPISMLLNLTTCGLVLTCVWATISLLYSMATYSISLVQQDKKTAVKCSSTCDNSA